MTGARGDAGAGPAIAVSVDGEPETAETTTITRHGRQYAAPR